jgi:hypothetical protein
MSAAISRHDHVHLCRANQERIEVTSEHLVRSKSPKPTIERLKFFRTLALRLNSCLLVEAFHHVCQSRDEKTASSACPVQNPLVLFGIEHVNDELDRAARSEILAAVGSRS